MKILINLNHCDYPVISAKIIEELSQPITAHLKIISDNDELQALDLLLPATLKCFDMGHLIWEVRGYITEIFNEDLVNRSQHIIKLQFESEISKLKQFHSQHVFGLCSLSFLLKEILVKCNLEHLNVSLQQDEKFDGVQFKQYEDESDWWFYLRVLEYFNLNFTNKLTNKIYIYNNLSSFMSYSEIKSIKRIKKTITFNEELHEITSEQCNVNIGDAILMSSKQHFFVNQIKHKYKVNGKDLGCCVYTITLKRHIKIEEKKKYKFTYLKAAIGYDKAKQCLDRHGCYNIKYHLTNSLIQHVPLLLPFGSQVSGFHMPMSQGDQVLISYLDNDINKPMIIRACSNKKVVTDQCEFKTAMDNALTFDTDKVVFETNHLKNKLSLNNSKQHPEIDVESGFGELLLNAKNAVGFQAEIFDEFSQVFELCSKDYKCRVFNGDAHYQSGNDFRLSAAKSVSYSATKDISLSSANNLLLDSNSAINITSQYCDINFKTSSLNINAENSICLESDSQITLSCDSSAIILNANGTMHITGSSIAKLGSTQYQGRVIHGLTPSIDVLTAIENIKIQWPYIKSLVSDNRASIVDLVWDKPQASLDNAILGHFRVQSLSHAGNATVEVYRKKCLTKYAEIPVKVDNGIVRFKWKPHLQSEAKCLQSIHPHISNQGVYYKVKLNDASGQNASTLLYLQSKLTLEFKYINKQCVQHNWNVEFNDINKQELLKIKNGKALKQDFAIDDFYISLVKDKSDCLELLSDNYSTPRATVHLSPESKLAKNYIAKINCLSPPLFKDFYDGSVNDNKQRLTHDEITQIKDDGNNITLFIHGFNVPLGRPGKHVDDVFVTMPTILGPGMKVPPTIDFKLSDYNASTYRDTHYFKNTFKQLHSISDQDLLQALENEHLNGTASHYWHVRMEDNLNRAKGFDRKNYSNYSRILMVQWDGEPGTGVDFMSAMPIATKTGQMLTNVLKQLITADIKIKSIGHSLGCRVLLACLNELGKDFHQVIEQAILWQAAVPNNIFSANSSYDPLWNFPHAVDACKHISVLYSKHDNVLGPLSSINSDTTSFEKIWLAKDFFGELLPALALTVLGLRSVYCLAVWLGFPLTHVFNPNNREQIYREWVSRHPSATNGEVFKPTLHLEVYELTKNKKIFSLSKVNSYDDLLLQLKTNLSLITNKISESLRIFIESITLSVFKKHYGDDWIRELLALNHVIYHSPYNPVDALGYSGLDLTDAKVHEMLSMGRISQHDQSKWLWAHSAMLEPNEAVMLNSYKNIIFGEHSF